MVAAPRENIPHSKVFHLRKAFYRLKYIPKVWFDKFSNVMFKHNFRSYYSDTANKELTSYVVSDFICS